MMIRHTGPRATGIFPDGTEWRRGVPVEVPETLAVALLAGGHETGTGKAVSPEWEMVPAPKPPVAASKPKKEE